jgi:hypothetical protein
VNVGEENAHDQRQHGRRLDAHAVS